MMLDLGFKRVEREIHIRRMLPCVLIAYPSAIGSAMMEQTFQHLAARY